MSECVTNQHYKNQSFSPKYCTQLFTNQMAVTNNTTTSEQCENPVVYICLIHLYLSEYKIYGYSSFRLLLPINGW